MYPGTMAFTLTPAGAYSAAKDVVRPVMLPVKSHSRKKSSSEPARGNKHTEQPGLRGGIDRCAGDTFGGEEAGDVDDAASFLTFVMGAEDHTAADRLTAVNGALEVGVYDVLDRFKICPGKQRILRDARAVDEDVGVTLHVDKLEESGIKLRQDHPRQILLDSSSGLDA
jgi:hypothetical protein